jgi:S-DNA-T family DNA segregation ATPase FtsK/SpoIIIE
MSKIDSRTILDTNGAEQLIGKGDLLLFTGSELIRIQNSYIDTSEVEALVDYIASQPSFPEPYLLPEVAMSGGDETGGEGGGEIEARDPMFEEAARIVVRNRAGSTSFIQRRLSLGYARAGRIMDQLQAVGIVGPADGSKPREVLVTDERELEKYL